MIIALCRINQAFKAQLVTSTEIDIRHLWQLFMPKLLPKFCFVFSMHTIAQTGHDNARIAVHLHHQSY